MLTRMSRFTPKRLTLFVCGILFAVPIVACARRFTVVLLPDTQYYSEHDPTVYTKQTQWIVANRKSKNVKYVIHLGDIVDDEDVSIQWTRADAAHDILDAAAIPYTIIPGNHDLPSTDWGRSRNTTRYNAKFGVSRFEALSLTHWKGGFPAGRNDNNYSFLDVDEMKFMVIGLEHAPRKDAMCWASRVIEANRDRRTIVATHCYQTHGGGKSGNCDTSYNLVGSAGETLWDELIRRHPQIFLAVSGHVGDSELVLQPRPESPTWLPVHELLTDYQFDRRGGDEHHGNGWLRWLRFVPGDGKIEIDVHSVLGETVFHPHRDEDGVLHYSSDPDDHRFVMPYNMTAPIPGALDPTPPLKKFSDRVVNSDDNREQLRPDVVRHSDGSFVVVWEDDSKGAEGVYQIYARGFDENGCERFADRTVNAIATGQQRDPAIAMDADGNFVVVWEDDSVEPFGYYQIKMRGFLADGSANPAIPQQTVNTVSTGQQINPDIAMDAAGNFVVVWEDDSVEPFGYYQIKMRGFKANGDPAFAQQTVNTVSTGQQRKPAVAMSPAGKFVVVWEDDSVEPFGWYQIKMRGFNADGTADASIPQQTVNTDATRQQLKPAIAMDNAGSFVIVWEDDSEDPAGVYEIKMRGFKANGDQAISQRTVNTVSRRQQLVPDVAMDASGNFVVVWQDDSVAPEDVYQIKARGFFPNGSERMSQRTVNRNSSGQQLLPVVALDGSERFVVAWQDDLEKNNHWEILARGCHVAAGC